jgi:hypothetical protein
VVEPAATIDSEEPYTEEREQREEVRLTNTRPGADAAPDPVHTARLKP